MSAPAANAFSEPVSTIARTRVEASISVSASPSSSQELAVQRVQRLGAVQPDGGDGVLDLDDDRLIGHARSPSASRVTSLTHGSGRCKPALRAGANWVRAFCKMLIYNDYC